MLAKVTYSPELGSNETTLNAIPAGTFFTGSIQRDDGTWTAGDALYLKLDEGGIKAVCLNKPRIAGDPGVAYWGTCRPVRNYKPAKDVSISVKL